MRDALLDELEGATVTPAALLRDLVSRLGPGTPAELIRIFQGLDPAKFDESYKIIRIRAAKEGVDIAELADALKFIDQILIYVGQRLKT